MPISTSTVTGNIWSQKHVTQANCPELSVSPHRPSVRWTIRYRNPSFHSQTVPFCVILLNESDDRLRTISDLEQRCTR
ncbi:MAG: hypothetical protein ACF8AM_15800 [Rhodopirellula sp. JB055]|uniref:hypothetical protein n=1 Tax=Rhodopirellula sp. JB055 TaxID=3342846 RepID=UPI00370BDDA6